MSVSPVILVQAGAGTYLRIIKMNATDMLVKGSVEAAKEGYRVLLAGGSAVDAAVAAVASFEDNECFNAGKGSHFTSDHTIELDASVMDGASLKVGGVTCVKTVKNPVKLARVVMDQCECDLLCGEGAEDFGKKHKDIEFTSQQYFATKYAHDRLKEHIEELKMGVKSTDVTMTNVQFTEHSDTVGAVVLDCHGNLAYATSTGGRVGQHPGRVGDVAIVGSGGYADNEVCAVSTTGVGEAILKVSLAKHIHLLMEQQGMSAHEASKTAVDYMKKKVGAYVGVVTLSKTGDHAVYFNSDGMLWTLIQDNTITWGISAGEKHSEIYK